MKLPLCKFILIFAFALLSANSVFAQTDSQKGIELYKKGDYKGAVKILKQAVKSNASDAQTWYFLGLTYLKQDKKKDSQKALEKAVALDDKDTKIRVALAYVYLLRNNSQEAQKEAQAVLALNPNDAEAHYIIGIVNFRNNQYDTAYERANKAVKISPNFAAAYLLKSESLISNFAVLTGTISKTQDAKAVLFKEATEALEKYLSLSPDNEETKFQREFLESLKFFSEYYDRPENQKPVNFDANNQPDNTGRTSIKILSKPKAAFTQKARESGVSGTIRLLVGFAADGKVKHILIIKSLGYGLNENVVRAARAIKFEPATKDGKPISVVKMVEYVFTLY